MPATSVIGLQWGDEAKGKIVDLLTDQHDIVVRYQGGANAGHTVVFQGQTFKLSLIPSGIFRPQVQCVVAGGVVLNPASLLDEIDRLAARGISIGSNLMISDRAHLIFPWHFAEDRLMDDCTGGEALGTTMRGIGPCYRDKVGRCYAVRLGDLYRENFAARIEQITQAKNQMFAGLGASADGCCLDAEEIYAQYSGYARRLEPFVADTTAYLLDAVDAGKRILFEGAQGALLDVDHGTFPFVTSSNSSGVGVSSGSGVPGRHIEKVIGVIKAYSTRVGGGPFPTEQDNETGQHIRERGNEYGTVTKRPRRCGWFDAVAVRYTARLSGADVLAVMLLDVLSRLAGAEDLRRLRAGRAADHRFPQPRRGPAPRAAGVRDPARLAEGDPRRPPPPRPARRREGLSRPPQRPDRLCRWRSSLSGPTGSRPSLQANSREKSVPRAKSTGLSAPAAAEFEVPREKRPRHIAVIMDGNGRWAQQRGLPRIEGHRHGVAAVRRTVEECARLEIQQLTLYCLSSENWKRPLRSCSSSCSSCSSTWSRSGRRSSSRGSA